MDDKVNTAIAFQQLQIDNYKSAVGKDVKDLTDDEKFAICFMAGCKYDTIVIDDYNYEVKTRYPCGIVKINGDFRVIENKGGQNDE